MLRTASLLLCAFASSASAQDWSGSWWGAWTGYGTGSYDTGVSDTSSFGPTVGVSDVMFGLNYTHNFQNGSVVYGFDLGLSSGLAGTKPVGSAGPNFQCGVGECNVTVHELFTLRGRLGWLLNQETLTYVAGGLAAGEYEGGIYNSSAQGDRNSATGYTVGVGIERMVQENMTVFGEINYVDLGTLNFGIIPFDNQFDGFGDFTTIKAGVNIRF